MSLPKDIVPDQDDARRRQLDDPLLGSVAAAADAAGLACPDAETLGLYAEQALARTERAAVEAHVRGCARCEAVVASITRALPGALTPGVTPEPVSTGLAGWLNGWRWLVPAMSLAGAAMVAFWMGRAPASEVQMTRTDAAPAVALSREADATRMTEAAPAAPAIVAAPTKRAAGAERDPGMAGTAATALTDSATAAQRQTFADAAVDRRAPAEAAANEAGAAPARPSDTAAFAPPAPPPPRAASAEAPAPAAAAPRSADAAREERTRAQALGRAKQAEPQAQAGAAQGAADFRAPYARWRVRDGVLEFARDGRDWQRVSLPTDERLASVVERPDASVLVITTSGAEFVSTDLGATWQRQ